MLITSREAARRLVAAHGMGEPRAREVLAVGLAGSATTVGNARLFDTGAVEALATRTSWTTADARQYFPDGVLIARVNAQRALHVGDVREDQLATVGSGWRLGLIPWVVVQASLKRHGVYPFIATVAGFPALCANITAISAELDRAGEVRCSLTLADPGGWHARMGGIRLVLGAGHEVVLLDPHFDEGGYRRADRLDTRI